MEKKLRLEDLKPEFEKRALWKEARGTQSFDALLCDTRLIESSPAEAILFFARRGSRQDAHDLLDQIKEYKNVKGVVLEHSAEKLRADQDYLLVKDSTEAMALAAKKFFGDPTKNALSIAVTGTNGKTTSCYLLESLLKAMGRKPAVLGTISSRFGNEETKSLLTTPDFSVIQEVFSNWKERGADSFVFEASSHAIHQRRLLGLDLDVAIFTNLSPEHLDYHKTMDDYFQAKARLFTELLASSPKKRRRAILPRDSGYGKRLLKMIQLLDLEVWSWGESGISDERSIRLKEVESQIEGLQFSFEWRGKTYSLRSPLIGRHNVENLLGAILFGLSESFSVEEVLEKLQKVSHIPGRLERVGKHPIFVDYAHTPDALENVLQSLRPLCAGELRLVFGCGGDRDRQKRALMGQVAELYADVLYITSDNPRTEDPQSIINEILRGTQKIKPARVDLDRRKSIQQAIADLKEGDLLVIAGKGHETTQEIQNQKIDFDDREVVRTYLGV